MLESIIFHFVFVLFAGWAFVLWLMVKNRLKLLRQSLIPLILLKKIEFPRDRSLLVRGKECLKNELEIIYGFKIDIEFRISSVPLNENFILPLCYLLEVKKSATTTEENKKFSMDENFFTVNELSSYLQDKKNIKHVFFQYDDINFIWKVRLQYEN